MSSEERKRYVYGPVPSRRLGRSLGVDLVPFKTCTFDCVYCQLGRTTNKTYELREWHPLEEVLEDVEAALSSNPDYITLSGSGEPTLFSRTGELIARIREMTHTPIALITNSSLLSNPEVRRAACGVDLAVPSLDAGSAESFRRVNRPADCVSFDEMVEGLVEFARRFEGRIWLEVMLVEGFTATEEEVERIARIARRLGPDRIQLNTPTRPPAEDEARPVPPERLEQFARMLGEKAEVIADFKLAEHGGEFQARREDVLSLLERRPCTLDDVAAGLDVHPNEALKHIDALLADGLVVAVGRGGRTYYEAGRGE